MSASLCIRLFTGTKEDAQDIRFFESELWTAESEMDLLARLQEVLSIIRSFGKTIEINISMQVTDQRTAVFLVQRKANGPFETHHQKLTVREIEILGLIMHGLTNHEIADKLFISYETVRSHRKNILEKTGTKNVVELMNYYHQTFFEK
jgi:DNA-binding NarL/FixJ family response regulator